MINCEMDVNAAGRFWIPDLSVLDVYHKLALLLKVLFILSGNIEGENSGKPGEVCCERCKFVISFLKVVTCLVLFVLYFWE